MKLIAPADLWLPAVGEEVKEGETVEVDAETGASLLEQGWKRAKATATADTKQEND